MEIKNKYGNKIILSVEKWKIMCYYNGTKETMWKDYCKRQVHRYDNSGDETEEKGTGLYE